MGIGCTSEDTDFKVLKKSIVDAVFCGRLAYIELKCDVMKAVVDIEHIVYGRRK